MKYWCRMNSIDTRTVLNTIYFEGLILTNYFMVSVFGWPDPNTRESCEG